MMMKEREENEKKTRVDDFMHYYNQLEFNEKRFCPDFIIMLVVEYRSNSIKNRASFALSIGKKRNFFSPINRKKRPPSLLLDNPKYI